MTKPITAAERVKAFSVELEALLKKHGATLEVEELRSACCLSYTGSCETITLNIPAKYDENGNCIAEFVCSADIGRYLY